MPTIQHAIGSRIYIAILCCLLVILVQSFGFSQQTDTSLAQDILAVMHARSAADFVFSLGVIVTA
jgi:hypothetical protein